MKAICIYEPRGEHGLEGYFLNEEYKYEEITRNGKRKIKIFIDEYYDIIGPGIFKKYFKQ